MIVTDISGLFKEISNYTNSLGEITLQGVSIQKKIIPNKKFGRKGFIHSSCSYTSDGNNFKINLRIPNLILGTELEPGRYDLYLESLFISNFGTVVANVKSIIKTGSSLKEINDNTLNEFCIDNGYFDIKKKDLPDFINRVSCITSFGGNIDANIIEHIGIPKDKIKIYHCKNAEEIVDKINNNQDVDIIALFRGGEEDANMMMFSDKIVIEAVVNSKVPICAALGHVDDTPFIYKIVDKGFSTPEAFAKSIKYHETDLNLKQIGNILFLAFPILIYFIYLIFKS